jgi:hypothetical protein
MITKFQQYIKEGVKDLMTPKSDEEVRQSYIRLVNSMKNCSVYNFPLEVQIEFEKIANLFGVSEDSLYLIEESGDIYYEIFDDFFGDIVDINNKVVVEGVKNKDGESSGDWICYPKQKLAKWSDNDFNNPNAWIFPKNFFSDKLYESIRDMMTPKYREEIISSLKGNKDIIFKPSDNTDLNMTYEIGRIKASYEDLAELFGECNGDIDDYKVTTAWNLVDNLGRSVGIEDWKQTNLYDPDFPSVDEFRNQPSYNWTIIGQREGGDELAEDLKTYIILQLIKNNQL